MKKVFKTIKFQYYEQWYEVVYVRELSQQYKMKCDSSRLSRGELLNRMLNGYPESEFPFDQLDALIITTLKGKYADINVKTTLISSRIVKENFLSRYTNRQHGQLCLNIIPERENLVFFEKLMIHVININIYPMAEHELPDYMRLETLDAEVPVRNEYEYALVCEKAKEILSVDVLRNS